MKIMDEELKPSHAYHKIEPFVVSKDEWDTMMDGVIVRAGSRLLLERTASSPAGRVGYSPDREAHATITLNSCTHVITIT